MALSVDEAWSTAQRIEKALYAQIQNDASTLGDFASTIAQYRDACEIVIFLNFDFAGQNQVETKLWDAHGKVNNRFRKVLAHHHHINGKSKPVEKRKLEKYYLDFIKGSQRFYRGYIQHLSTEFGGISELEKVAHAFNPEASSTKPSAEIAPRLQQLVLLSCHATLVRLGDLSRYREAELKAQGRNWGPAVGYYELAGIIYPASGASHNQLAVIALTDGSHLRALYHLYRALSVEEPHPTAKGNLEIEFKKILAAWSKGQLIGKGIDKESNTGRALLAWFVRLHAKCYKGVEFSGHDELEREVLSQLAVDLKERSLETTLHKFILTNVAAEYFAGIRVQENPKSESHRQSFFFFLRFNVKTFTALLRLLQTELESLGKTDLDVHGDKETAKGQEKVTAVTRRILPGLRQYSSWLRSSVGLLTAELGDSALSAQVKKLWQGYATALTLLAANFPARELPSVEYLLEEDEDTIGFKPFDQDQVHWRYWSGENEMKPRWHDQGIERNHPNVEMLARIRDFLTDGLELAVGETVPITLLEEGKFEYGAEKSAAEPHATPADQRAESPTTKTIIGNGMLSLPGSTTFSSESVDSSNKEEAPANVDPPEPASVSMNAEMHHMVDSLVGPEQTPSPIRQSFRSSYDEAGSIASSPINTGSFTAADLLERVQSYSNQSSPKMFTPHLPSIYNTPFAPQPASPQTRPSTAQRSSPLHRHQWSAGSNTISSTSGTHPRPAPIQMREPGFGNVNGSITAVQGAGEQTESTYGTGSMFDGSHLTGPWTPQGTSFAGYGSMPARSQGRQRSVG